MDFAINIGQPLLGYTSWKILGKEDIERDYDLEGDCECKACKAWESEAGYGKVCDCHKEEEEPKGYRCITYGPSEKGKEYYQDAEEEEPKGHIVSIEVFDNASIKPNSYHIEKSTRNIKIDGTQYTIDHILKALKSYEE